MEVPAGTGFTNYAHARWVQSDTCRLFSFASPLRLAPFAGCLRRCHPVAAQTKSTHPTAWHKPNRQTSGSWVAEATHIICHRYRWRPDLMDQRLRTLRNTADEQHP